MLENERGALAEEADSPAGQVATRLSISSQYKRTMHPLGSARLPPPAEGETRNGPKTDRRLPPELSTSEAVGVPHPLSWLHFRATTR